MFFLTVKINRICVLVFEFIYEGIVKSRSILDVNGNVVSHEFHVDVIAIATHIYHVAILFDEKWIRDDTSGIKDDSWILFLYTRRLPSG